MVVRSQVIRIKWDFPELTILLLSFSLFLCFWTSVNVPITMTCLSPFVHDHVHDHVTCDFRHAAFPEGRVGGYSTGSGNRVPSDSS